MAAYVNANHTLGVMIWPVIYDGASLTSPWYDPSCVQGLFTLCNDLLHWPQCGKGFDATAVENGSNDKNNNNNGDHKNSNSDQGVFQMQVDQTSLAEVARQRAEENKRMVPKL